MVNFDNFGGLKSVLKFHIFIFSTCEKLVRVRLVCEELFHKVETFEHNFERGAI